MSLFNESSAQILEKLQELPTTHTREEIEGLVERLREDVALYPDMSFTDKVRKWSDPHRELCLSYPMLYRTICKGTYRPQCLDILLDVRESIEKGLPKEKGLEEMIRRAVDEVNNNKSKQE